MAKWKLDNGEIIESNCTIEHQISHKIYETYSNVKSIAPRQFKDRETNISILLEDGKVKYARLIKEPDPFRRWWEDNKVDGFHLVTEYKKYWLGNHDNNEGVLSSILKSWTLERQIKTLKTLIELYKD